MTAADGAGRFRGEGGGGEGAATPCDLTSVDTAEVYIGVCPVDINTGCGNNRR